jgi:hypothetical protein
VYDGVDAIYGLGDAVDLLDAALEELDVGEALQMAAFRRAAHQGTHAVASAAEQLGDVTP